MRGRQGDGGRGPGRPGGGGRGRGPGTGPSGPGRRGPGGRGPGSRGPARPGPGGSDDRRPGDRRPDNRRSEDRRPDDRRPEDRRPPRRFPGPPGGSEGRGPFRPRREGPAEAREQRPPRKKSEAYDFAQKVLAGHASVGGPPPPLDTPPPPGAKLIDVQRLVATIEKLVAGGEGLTRFEGVPIFVPRSAPGDRLRIKITERKPDYGRAEIVEILEPGPDRRPDPAPELSLTGVCDLQHLHEAAQSRLKAEAVRETLAHIGKLALPPEIPVITGEPWGYRLKTQIHTDVDPVAGGVRVGYHARGTNTVIPLSRCPLLVPELEAFLAEMPAQLTADTPRRIDIAAGDGGQITVSPVIPGLPHGEVSTRVGEFTYSYDARCFFQSHRGLLPKLIELAVGPWEGETALDLYSGVGLFSLPLSRKYRRVTAVEADQIGARYGRLNVKRNRVDNIETVNQVVESWINRLPSNVDRVLLDPPRGGLAMRTRGQLKRHPPARLTYVSCHAAALARDLRSLQEVFEVESIVLVDLFPQTGHMEVVVQMVRKEESATVSQG